jgi:dihydrofolate reductase
MRKIIWLVHMSADGFVSGPAGELDWAGANIDDELWEHVNQPIATSDAALFGRITYQNFEQYWRAVAVNPASSKNDRDFSHWIEGAQKIVASTTLGRLQWQNSTLLRDDVLNEIARLKKQPGKNILLFASFSLAARLLQANLIDELQMEMHPLLLGVGRPWCSHAADRRKLKLISFQTFCSGVIGLRYNVA